MASVRPPRRPAGVRFEVLAQPLGQVLPRMDIALFVGFAASGPLHVPVAIDDPSHFQAIFGADAPLAWDPSQGAVLNAYLAPAVRSYFRNGGRRCWVVRVAGDGATNTFPVPGLVCRGPEGSLQPAFATARSQGRWSDALRASAVLQSRPLVLPVPLSSLAPESIDVVTSAMDDVVVGDLMRITYDLGGESRVAMFVAASVQSLVPSRSAPATLRIGLALTPKGNPDITWFRTSSPVVPVGSRGLAAGGAAAVLLAAAGGSFSLQVAVPFGVAPPVGTTLGIAFEGAQLWLTVSDVVAAPPGGSPPSDAQSPPGAGAVVLTGHGLYLDPSPDPLPRSSPPVGVELERLQLQLQTQTGEESPIALAGLGFDPSHAKAFWALPSDLELFRGTGDTIDTDPRSMALRRRADDLAPLWNEAAEPRFALASDDDPGVTYFPVGMPYTPLYRAAARVPDGTGLERDGLAAFDGSLFVDPELGGAGAAALVAEANFIQYQASVPRRLQGIHAALGVTEATLIAVPDAALPGWHPREPPLVPPGLGAQPVVPGADGSFYECSQRALALPDISVSAPPDDDGTFALAWGAVPGASGYTIEESPDPQFVRGVVARDTTDTRLLFYGHAPGVFYYRASATSGAASSGWSASIAVSVLVGQGWVVREDASDPAPALASVQGALLTLCAARGDLFALLSLPPYQTAKDAAAYVSVLCAAQPAATLGYGAVYHPWVISQETPSGPLRTTPPDGAVAGLYAQRTLARGAWIAPANRALASNVLGLTPSQPDDLWAVLDGQPVNRIREEARGLMPMSADTLSADPSLVLVNVRRLLSLLSRTAMSWGNDYVFEPNGQRLARTVQRRFTTLLDGLYRQGAFAGATASQAYRVVTDSTVNTPESVDRGRFIVELQVAPAWPLSFLTVRLVQTGNQLSVTQSS